MELESVPNESEGRKALYKCASPRRMQKAPFVRLPK